MVDPLRWPRLRSALRRAVDAGAGYIDPRRNLPVVVLPDGTVRQLGRLDQLGDDANAGARLIYDGSGWVRDDVAYLERLLMETDINEDFVSTWDADHLIGTYPWNSWVSGSGSVAKVSSNGANVYAGGNVGVVQAASGTTSGSQALMGLGSAADDLLPSGGLPDGCEFACKIRVSTLDTNMQAWIGLAEGYGGAGYIPDSAYANNVSFFGLLMRAGASSTNWQACCRDGSGAGNETLLDLGVAADDTFHGFVLSTVAGAVRCYADDGAGGLDYIGTISTNVPTAALSGFFGTQNDTAANRLIGVDRWRLRGHWRRY